MCLFEYRRNAYFCIVLQLGRKNRNYLNEVTRVSEQIFHQIQMAFLFRNSVYRCIQLFRVTNAGYCNGCRQWNEGRIVRFDA